MHIVAPAIEKTAEQVAELLSAVEGKPVPAELEALTAAARRQLRETFLTADVGITGANFAVAETGSICLVTNEGNGRLRQLAAARARRADRAWSGSCRRSPTSPCCCGCSPAAPPARS